jgi:molybdenum cofactor synthesis domain-containing protein
MTEVQLLDKTEIWVRGVTSVDADLPAIARAVADTLSLPADRVFVTDLGPEHICFDILIPRLKLVDFAGKQARLLDALRAIPGLTVSDAAAVHSEGILGLIGTPEANVPAILEEAARMEEGIKSYAAKRVAVVSTGAELVDGRVHDTNCEAVRELMGAAGYEVDFGGTVGDDEAQIAGRVNRLAGEGYGIVITTGGVGAEAKDKTVEALTLLDPAIATAVLAQFEAGHGRHVKDSIRIAVARVGYGIAVALPGPTHEVRTALPVLLAELAAGSPPEAMAEAIARPLRALLPSAMHKHHHRHGHGHHGHGG